MRERYFIFFVDVLFYGFSNIVNFFKKILKFFDIEYKVEMVILEEYEKIRDKFEKYKKKIFGKKVIIFFGGLRIGFMVGVFKEVGFEICVCGS